MTKIPDKNSLGKKAFFGLQPENISPWGGEGIATKARDL